MTQNHKVTVYFSEGEDFKGNYIKGLQIDIDNDPYAYYKESQLQTAIKTLLELQNDGCAITIK